MLKELSVELPEELISKLEGIADEQGVSVSVILKQYLHDFLGRRRVETVNNNRRSYRIGEFDPKTFKLTPEELAENQRIGLQMEQFVKKLEQKYADAEPVSAVQLVREGRRDL
jgi:predicted transcriptional regulator